MRLVAIAALALLGCGGTVIRLHAPEISAAQARKDAARVDLEPIASPRGAVVAELPSGESIAPKPDAAAVLTSAMRAELEGRALRGGERGGYVVRCTLDRFAVRDEAKLAGAGRMTALYVDASCDVERAADKALAWRGALRGRACAVGTTSPLASTLPLVQQLVDAMTSDAAREMASDLALRVLGLDAEPSARVFADEEARAKVAGIDDGPLGGAALGERVTPDVERARKDEASAARAGAWNAIAMSAGPGEAPAAVAGIARDEDERVRFYQYKALARVGSAEALASLRALAAREEDSLLVELASDSLASGGIGVARRGRGSTNASAVTSGTTTSP